MEKDIVIGIDIDNTITADINSLRFFQLFTSFFYNKVRIVIITNREITEQSIKETKQELADLNIVYDNLYVTADKATVIKQEKVTVYFDDTDEYFLDVPEDVTVFKIRESGNFDFSEKKWFYSNKTGIDIDKRKKHCD